MKSISFVVFFLSAFMCGAQSSVNVKKGAERVVVYYEYMRPNMVYTDSGNVYYSSGKYIDSLKEGVWLYFYPDGKLFAKGKYKAGTKTGVWHYYSGSGYKVRYTRLPKITENVFVNNTGKLIIKDTIKKKNGKEVTFINGIQERSNCIIFLED